MTRERRERLLACLDAEARYGMPSVFAVGTYDADAYEEMTGAELRELLDAHAEVETAIDLLREATPLVERHAHLLDDPEQPYRVSARVYRWLANRDVATQVGKP